MPHSFSTSALWGFAMQTSAAFGLLLIAGNQTHQENYARAFATDSRCRLIGLTDESNIPARRRELNHALADELGIPYFADFEAAIRRDDVQLVSICAEPERRLDLTIACARAGKHLYLDKDPAPTVEAARQIGAVVREAGVLSQAFSMVRTPAAQRAKAIVEFGELGELIGLHCDITFAKGLSGTADLSRPRIEQSRPTRFSFIESKREFLCVGYYAVVLMQWLTGRRFQTVDATTSNYFFAEHQRNDVEDFATVLLSLDGGIEAAIVAGRCGWSSSRAFGQHDIRLIGTRGSVSIDANQPRLEVFSDSAAWQPPSHAHPDDPMGFWSSTQKAGGVTAKSDWFAVGSAVRNDFAYFLDCLESGRESDVPIGTAIHAVEVVHAVYESAATGASVKI